MNREAKHASIDDFVNAGERLGVRFELDGSRAAAKCPRCGGILKVWTYPRGMSWNCSGCARRTASLESFEKFISSLECEYEPGFTASQEMTCADYGHFLYFRGVVIELDEDRDPRPMALIYRFRDVFVDAGLYYMAEHKGFVNCLFSKHIPDILKGDGIDVCDPGFMHTSEEENGDILFRGDHWVSEAAVVDRMTILGTGRSGYTQQIPDMERFCRDGKQFVNATYRALYVERKH